MVQSKSDYLDRFDTCQWPPAYGFKKFLFMCACVVSLFMHAWACVKGCPKRLEEGVRLPGAGVTGGCQPPCGRWESEPGRVEEPFPALYSCFVIRVCKGEGGLLFSPRIAYASQEERPEFFSPVTGTICTEQDGIPPPPAPRSAQWERVRPVRKTVF